MAEFARHAVPATDEPPDRGHPHRPAPDSPSPASKPAAHPRRGAGGSGQADSRPADNASSACGESPGLDKQPSGGASGDPTDLERRHAWLSAALERFERPLLGYALRLTGCPDRARDVVQDVFTRLCRADAAKLDGRLAEWLYTVCRNRATDLRRKDTRMVPMSATAIELEQARQWKSPLGRAKGGPRDGEAPSGQESGGGGSGRGGGGGGGRGGGGVAGSESLDAKDTARGQDTAHERGAAQTQDTAHERGAAQTQDTAHRAVAHDARGALPRDARHQVANGASPPVANGASPRVANGAWPRTDTNQSQPAAELVQREETDRVLRAMAALPARQQEALRLKFQADLSYQQIAAVMKTSTNNVGVMLHTAIKKLRERLGENQRCDSAL